MAEVACDQCCTIGKGDTGDKQVGTPDPSVGAAASQPVELCCHIDIDGHDRQVREECLGAIVQVLRSQEFITNRGFQQKLAAPAHEFDVGDDCSANIGIVQSLEIGVDIQVVLLRGDG